MFKVAVFAAFLILVILSFISYKSYKSVLEEREVNIHTMQQKLDENDSKIQALSEEKEVCVKKLQSDNNAFQQLKSEYERDKLKYSTDHDEWKKKYDNIIEEINNLRKQYESGNLEYQKLNDQSQANQTELNKKLIEMEQMYKNLLTAKENEVVTLNNVIENLKTEQSKIQQFVRGLSNNASRANLTTQKTQQHENRVEEARKEAAHVQSNQGLLPVAPQGNDQKISSQYNPVSNQSNQAVKPLQQNANSLAQPNSILQQFAKSEVKQIQTTYDAVAAARESELRDEIGNQMDNSENELQV